jgi:hypothetical protein
MPSVLPASFKLFYQKMPFKNTLTMISKKPKNRTYFLAVALFFFLVVVTAILSELLKKVPY